MLILKLAGISYEIVNLIQLSFVYVTYDAFKLRISYTATVLGGYF